MTKAEREKDWDEGLILLLSEDECRVQIAKTQFHKAHIFLASPTEIVFKDNEGRLWKSTEPYTIVVTKEVNSDDEEDEDKLD